MPPSDSHSGDSGVVVAPRCVGVGALARSISHTNWRYVAHARPVSQCTVVAMQHDATYKAAFAHPRMIRDQLILLEQLLGDQLPMLRRLRLDTLERLPSEYLTDNLEQRFGDMAWRVALQPSAADDEADEPHWLHILVMLEFQSRPDWMMAARVQSYATLLYLALHREKPFSASNPVPPVLPIVLYNGSSPWHAPLNLSALTRPGGIEAASADVSAQAKGETGKPGALGAHVGPMGLVGDGYVLVDQQALLGEELPEGNAATLLAWIEGLTSPEDLKRVVERCLQWLSGVEDGSLLGVLQRWLEAWVRNADIGDEEEWLMKLVRLRESTDEVVRQPADPAERVALWKQQLIEKGRTEGEAEGEARGRAEGEARGEARGRAEGEARGRAEGEAKALARERALLERMVALRFGGDTAKRFGVLLAGISDPERLDEVGEWLIECPDGASLLARMGE